jgi:hypothetical protein
MPDLATTSMLITLVPVIVGGVIGLAGGFGPIAKMDQSECTQHHALGHRRRPGDCVLSDPIVSNLAGVLCSSLLLLCCVICPKPAQGACIEEIVTDSNMNA